MADVPVPPPPAFLRRRLRWAVPPLAAAVLLGAFGLAPTLAGTQAAPILPPISTQDLVAKVLGAESIAGFTGTIETHTDLGLPSLSGLGPTNSSLLTTLLADHTIKAWYASGGKVRLAIPDSLAETDVVSDGTQVWVWQSANQTVTHLTKPAETDNGTDVRPPEAADLPASPEDDTPPALAGRLLASADPTTRVFVRGTASVAGRDAYELVLAPRATDTTVADAVIDVDAATGLPLRVQVLPQNAASPALDVGFTSLTLGAPAASNFTFTVPPGATVNEVTSPEQLLYGPEPQRRLHRAGAGKVAPGTPTAPNQVPNQGPIPAPDATTSRRQIVGAGWDAVAVLPPPAPRQLAEIGSPVSGSWGTGRLVTSKLVNALILPDGRMLVGLVTPDRLETAAGQLGS